MRTLPAMMVSLGLFVGATGAGAQDVGFGGLTNTSTVVAQSDRYRVAATVDATALDADLQAAEEAALRALGGFKALVTASDVEEGDFYRAYAKPSYAAMRQAAATVQKEGARARALLEKVAGVFAAAFREPMPQATELELLERVARATRVITLYDTLAAYAHAKPMRYETVGLTPGNELRAGIADDLVRVALPRVQMTVVDAEVSTRQTTLAGRASGGEPVVRDQATVGRTRTTLSLPLPAERLRVLVVEAGRTMAAAQDLKNKLLAARVEETRRTHHDHDGGGLYLESLEYRGELATFERDVKPLVADFAVAMACAKAVRNELVTWLDVADAFVGELNLRAAADESLKAFDALAAWGEGWIVCYDSWKHLERQFRMIPSVDFLTVDLVTSGSVIARPDVAGPGAPGSTVARLTMAQLREMLDKVYTGERFELAKRNLPRLTDLTMDSALDLASYFYTADQDRFLRLVEAELDRRAGKSS